MAIDLLEEIEQILAGTHATLKRVNYIDLFRIRVARDRYLTWSTAEVPDSFTGDGNNYSARVIRCDPLPYEIDFKDSTISIVFDNTDGLVKDLTNQEILWVEGEVAVCRLFPDLSPPDNRIGTWDEPMWVGWISQAPTYEVPSTMKVSSGFPEYSREALRRISRTCTAIQGTEHFPYDPLKGKGIPENRVSGTAISGNSTKLYTTDDISFIEPGWQLFLKTKKIVGVVVSVTESLEEIEIDKWRYDGADTALVPDTEDWICGPAFTRYDGTLTMCMNMGMFGPSREQPETDLNVCTRRFFTGVTNSGNSFLEPGAPVTSIFGNVSGESSVSGAGKDGEVIPVRVGKFKATWIPMASGVVKEEGFIHALGLIGEGRIEELLMPKLNGNLWVDNINDTTEAEDDSWIEGGTNYEDSSVGSANDYDAIAAGELTESQVMQAIGSRQTYHHGWDSILDTYLDNPWKFNDEHGGGNALGCLAWCRGRWENRELASSGAGLTITQAGTGIIIQRPDDVWSAELNPVDLLYGYLGNKLWGAGLGASRLLKASWLSVSDLANEETGSGTSDPSVSSGSIVAGPEEIEFTGAPEMYKNVIIVPADTLGESETATEQNITVITSGGEYEMAVRFLGPTPGTFAITDENWNSSRITFVTAGICLVLDHAFPDNDLPVGGDTFYLGTKAKYWLSAPKKYNADGDLSKKCKVSEMVRDICKNFNGNVYQKGGKIVPVIRDLVLVSVIQSNRIFTDHGSNRNIVKDKNGKTTFKFVPKHTKDIPTSVRVQYKDINQRFSSRFITIRSKFSEERIRELTGEDARNRKSVTLDLCLTGSLEQAVKLGTLYLREHGFIEEIPSYHPGDYSLKVPIHYAQEIAPVEDVHEISGENFADWCTHMRITGKKDDSVRGIVSLTGIPYLEKMYNFDMSDFVIIPGPVITTETSGDPVPVEIASVVESEYYDEAGQRFVVLTGEITLS